MDRTPREVIVFIGRRLSQRWTSNAAGGNMSLRVRDQIYISPRYADYYWGWELSPDDIVCGPIESDELLGNPSFSREGRAHLGIYRAFPEAGAFITCPPFLRDALLRGEQRHRANPGCNQEAGED